MAGTRLSPLQVRVLDLLARVQPPWVLSGGGALAHAYLQHRETKDLDLFWHGRDQLDLLPGEITSVLRSAGLSVDRVHAYPGFARLRVADSGSAVLVDLVATTAELTEPPVRVRAGTMDILIDARHDILVNKLTALLGRRELRDLIDLHALCAAGGDLDRALRDASRKDGGFSPATLAWVLRDFPVRALGSREGMAPPSIDTLEAYRDGLIERLVLASRPG